MFSDDTGEEIVTIVVRFFERRLREVIAKDWLSSSLEPVAAPVGGRAITRCHA